MDNGTFNNFEFEDVNPTTLALTGNNQVCINGFSNIKATISVLNKAEAIKSATMSKYRFSISNISTDISYKDDSNVSGVINNAKSGTFNVFAIDSRNNSTLVTKLAQSEINYEPIYIDKQNSKIERDDNRVGDNAILTLNGTLWNDDFGDVVNSITSVTYRLKKTDSSTWIDGTTTITPTITDDKFTFTGLIASDNLDTSWDLEASYNVEVTIEDELSISTAEFILNSAIPTMSLDKNGVGIMCAYDNSIGGALQVAGQKINTGGEDITINSSVSSGNVYKTGRIINGKEEYIFYGIINSLPNATATSYATPIKLADIDIVTEIGGTALRSRDNVWFQLNASRQSLPDQIGIQASVSGNYFGFYIQTGSNRSDLRGYVYFTFIYNN